jgi:hypothetical protein
MKTPINSRIRKLGLASAVALVATFALATVSLAQLQDNSSESVAEAARKAKERKKAAPKENRVITEDTLNLRPASSDSPGTPPAGTVVNTTPVLPSSDAAPGVAAPTADTNSTAAKPVQASTADDDAKKKAELAAAVARTKELLAQAQTELDILKRRLALDSDSFYSNPDYARDTNGKTKLDGEKQSIGDKQISVEDLKRKLTELMEKAGISADDQKPASAPQR